ncbi:MAG: hypothetical protein ABFS16_12135 [Bacteroidota bacterium]
MKILRGTILGAIAYFLLGWLVYGILLMDFSAANYNQCISRADGVMIWWALIASNLVLALFLTLFLKWSGAKTLIDGLKTGALFGLLMSLTLGLSYYSMTTMYNNFTGIIVDVVVSVMLMAIVGMIIVITWGKH